MSKKQLTLVGYRLVKGHKTIETLMPDKLGRVEISRVRLDLKETKGLTQLAHGIGCKLVPIYNRS